ncbi:MAG TPA: fibronectin type III domain-containing protein [Acidimicrobiales bacterium]|nr:fibronectin type III domain-containing protein [Acidimicrobiales bacterium]
MSPRRRFSLPLFLCLALVAGMFALGTGTASAAATPRDDPARGLKYAGLERATQGPCKGKFEIRPGAGNGPARCSHGPDAAPEGIDVRVAREPESPAESALRPAPETVAATVCTGDGSSGPRVQLVYANITGRTDRYATYAASFQTWAAAMDAVFDRSAAETGGSRRIRFVHDAACTPVIARTTLSVTAANDFQTTVNELTAKGFSRNDRKYMVWVDANVYCGIGEIYTDDRAGQNNYNNLYSLISRVDNGCWGVLGQSVEAHELMHNLGGVQASAPNATPYSHCTDESDRMCYADGSGRPMVQKCASSHENTFDCNHDDYFSTAPPAGSYLATHWNAANSAWLRTGAAAATVPGAPIGVTAVPGEGTASLTWTAPASNGGQPVTAYVVTPYVGATAQPARTFTSAATAQTVTGLAENTYTFKVAAVNSVGTGPQSAASSPVTPSLGARFNPLPPARILDTREGNGAPTGRVAQGGAIDLQVTGRGGVPVTGVSAVALNVTVTEPTALSYLTAWPTGDARPLASNLNYTAGQTVPNLVVVKVGAGGKVSLYNNAGTTHVIADVSGWYGAGGGTQGSRYHPVAPSRLLDTRSGLGAVASKLAPQGALDLQVTGRAGVPATGVTAVAVNVTVTEPSAGGFLTTWPTGGLPPLASSLNFATAQTVANLAVVKVGSDGKISFFNGGGGVHVVADVAGWFGPEGEATGARFHPLAPARALDTRSGNGAPVAPLASGSSLSLQVTGRGGVPATGVSAVILNVIAVDPVAGGYLTVWPNGEALPLASNLNFAAGRTVPNLVVAKVGAGGKVNIFNGGGAAHLVADVAGWYGSA